MKRIKAVEREHSAARFAADYLLDAVRQDPNVLADVIWLRDVSEANSHLEGTYIVRIFAEFETSLRSFWLASRGDLPARTRDLLDGIGARRKIPVDQIRHAHTVREYRNRLVHERDNEKALPIPIATARSHLCYYLSFLPLEW